MEENPTVKLVGGKRKLGKNEDSISEREGLNSGGRRRQLGELCDKYQVEVVCLQETIKQSFKQRELDNLVRGVDMEWKWIASRGRSGGLLIGANKDSLEVLDYKEGIYF